MPPKSNNIDFWEDVLSRLTSTALENAMSVAITAQLEDEPEKVQELVDVLVSDIMNDPNAMERLKQAFIIRLATEIETGELDIVEDDTFDEIRAMAGKKAADSIKRAL